MVRVLILILVLSVSGCSTVIVRSNGGEFGHPFSGPIQSVLVQPCGFMFAASFLLIPYPFILADIPLSLAADAMLLPIDLFMILEAGPAYNNVQYYPPAECVF